MYKILVMLFLLTLTACSTTPSVPLTEQTKVEEKLLQAPISQSLLIPCRVAYPLKENTQETSLKAFYEVLAYNLGQVKKCYEKEEDLIEELKERDYVGKD
ncbi:MAG: hypothetical protein GOVbin2917_45 [Prokaryotic dsDNA virus sp.]|nr:MAG: hypothetical protein GOVbin2917_45 [Prokaryotic dsDNA virus sp.]